MVFEWSAKNIKLLKRALATGKDQPELIAMRNQAQKTYDECPAREAARKAEQAAYVFTAEDEKKYSGYIKKRKLWEGACNLNWAKYRKYRAAKSGLRTSQRRRPTVRGSVDGRVEGGRAMTPIIACTA